MAHALDFNSHVVPLELFADNPLRLAPEDHPNGYWNETHGNYNQWWAFYKGYTLNKKANGLDVYPVKLNLVRPAVLNRAALLLGQITDRIVRFGVSNAYGVNEALGQEITLDLNQRNRNYQRLQVLGANLLSLLEGFGVKEVDRTWRGCVAGHLPAGQTFRL